MSAGKKIIAFNEVVTSKQQKSFVNEAMENGAISSNGKYSGLCEEFLEKKIGTSKSILTTSCTSALEMAAILLEIGDGDEVIIPSFTFVSTANAFALRGAKIRFVDSRFDHPGLDENSIESMINAKTKAIVVVHYAGVACDMEKVLSLARKHSLYVVEDAAQAIDSYYNNKHLGSFSDISTFSFHATKNITCGEGGCINIQNENLIQRAEIISDMGTNRKAFFNGQVDFYEWMDLGLSVRPSDLNSALLWGQFLEIDEIQSKRSEIWHLYHILLENSNLPIKLPVIPKYASNNAHIFYIVLESGAVRKRLIRYLDDYGIKAQFHYRGLHQSEYYGMNQPCLDLPNSDRYSDCLLRLPLHLNLSELDVEFIVDKVVNFYRTSGISK